MRIIVDLRPDQVAALAELCASDRISRAEAIRRAIQGYLVREEREQIEFERAVDAAFGMWKDRGVDTDTYLAEIRSEWEREWVDGEWVYKGVPTGDDVV